MHQGSGYYPLGAEEDMNAPYNKEPISREVEQPVLVTEVLEKWSKVHMTSEDDDLEELYIDEHYGINKFLEMLTAYIRKDLSLDTNVKKALLDELDTYDINISIEEA